MRCETTANNVFFTIDLSRNAMQQVTTCIKGLRALKATKHSQSTLQTLEAIHAFRGAYFLQFRALGATSKLEVHRGPGKAQAPRLAYSASSPLGGRLERNGNKKIEKKWKKARGSPNQRGPSQPLGGRPEAAPEIPGHHL
jgi:hypothetical protein